MDTPNYEEAIHKIHIVVEGLDRKAEYEFLISDMEMRKAWDAKDLLGIELHDRVLEVFDRWLSGVATRQEYRDAIDI